MKLSNRDLTMEPAKSGPEGFVSNVHKEWYQWCEDNKDNPIILEAHLVDVLRQYNSHHKQRESASVVLADDSEVAMMFLDAMLDEWGAIYNMLEEYVIESGYYDGQP